MSTNWKAILEASQAKQFVLPNGWDTRDAVAEQIGCSPDNVRKLMSQLIKSGAAVFKQLPLWDYVSKRVRSVACYRRTAKE